MITLDDYVLDESGSDDDVSVLGSLVPSSGLPSPPKDGPSLAPAASALRPPSKQRMNLLDKDAELVDPTPDVHALFLEYDRLFFDGCLACVELKWSPRMTLCAGICVYQGQHGLCSVYVRASRRVAI